MKLDLVLFFCLMIGMMIGFFVGYEFGTIGTMAEMSKTGQIERISK